MYPPSESNSTLPLATYEKELRDLFAMHRMRFGSPEDVVPFTEALTAPGTFHDEMTSMIRSIFLRHGGNVPRAELLRLVMVAVAGPQIDESAEQYLPSIQETVKFLGEVHRTRWGIIPTELTAVDEAGTLAEKPPQLAPQAPLVDRGFPVAGGFQPEKLDLSAPDIPRESLPPRRSPEIFFRSQMMKATPEDGTRADGLTPLPTPMADSIDAAPVVAAPQIAARNVESREAATAEVAASALAVPHAAPATVVAAEAVVLKAAPAQVDRPVHPQPVAKTPVVAAPLRSRSLAEASTPDEAVGAPRNRRKALWISLALLVLLVAAIAGVLFYEQYIEDKNWPTRHLPAATAPEIVPSLPLKNARIPAHAAGAPPAAAPIHVRGTARPLGAPVHRPLPPAEDPIDPASIGLDQTNVPTENVPIPAQERQPAPVIRVQPAAPAPVIVTPNPPPNTSGTPPQ